MDSKVPNRPVKKLSADDVVNVDLLSDDALITKRQLRASVFRVSNNTLWRRIKEGKFPAPVSNDGLCLWRVGDVREAVRNIARRVA